MLTISNTTAKLANDLIIVYDIDSLCSTAKAILFYSELYISKISQSIMDILIIVNIIVGLIVLITFFNIAARLKSIKELTAYDLRHKTKVEYYLHYLKGNKEEAYNYLLRNILTQLTIDDISDPARRIKYEELKKRYSKLFEDLGYEFPAYIF
jgi:hypothetical protein